MGNLKERLGSIKIILLALAIGGAAWGCGGGGSTTQTGGSSVKVTFVGGVPAAVASQVGGTGAFTTITPASTVTIAVPSGNTKYAVAYLCALPGEGLLNTISVIEATTQDTNSFNAFCGLPSSGTATGSASSSITGTAAIAIEGAQSSGASITGTSGTFSTTMPVGTNDVAAIALDSSSNGNVLGVKILRSQAVPGTVNGGAAITLGSSDQTLPQSLTVTSVPSGFGSPPEASVTYHTANGTGIILTNGLHPANPMTYQAVPSAATQSGDFYEYESNTGNGNSSVGIHTTTTSGGGAFTISLPAAWTFAGPTAAQLPTFTFAYTGFSGQAAVADQAQIQWQTSATSSNVIAVTATANFQSGSTTITIPDFSAVSGFFGAAASGTTIFWAADIFGGSAQNFASFPNSPANGTLMFVQNTGSFVQP